MATIDDEDVEIVTEALYIAVRGSLDDWHADSGLIQDSYRNNARAILTRLADRLLPRDVYVDVEEYHADGERHLGPPCDRPVQMRRRTWTEPLREVQQ